MDFGGYLRVGATVKPSLPARRTLGARGWSIGSRGALHATSTELSADHKRSRPAEDLPLEGPSVGRHISSNQGAAVLAKSAMTGSLNALLGLQCNRQQCFAAFARTMPLSPDAAHPAA